MLWILRFVDTHSSIRRCPAEMAEEIGIAKRAPKILVQTKWKHKSLKYDRPSENPEQGKCDHSIYRGLVPAKKKY